MDSRRIAILTRPAFQNAGLSARLRHVGWSVLSAPALVLTPIPTPPELDPDPAHFDLVVFVSGAAARIFLDRRAERGLVHWPADVAAATVGPASANALRDHIAFGPLPRVYCPSAGTPSLDSEALHVELTARQARRDRVLIVRGETGRDWLARRLAEEGAHVLVHAAYRREPAVWSGGIWRQLSQWCQARAPAVWLYTSTEGIESVGARFRGGPVAAWWAGCDAIVTHPRLVSALVHAQAAAEAPASQENAMCPNLLTSSASCAATAEASTPRGSGRVHVVSPEEPRLFDAFVAL